MKELIKKILREEYSPAGKEITPNRIVVHKSNPIFRDNIMSEGLKAKAGECYKIYVGYGTKCKPAIFATNSTNKRAWFDSTYDDDIWFIDTTKIPNVKWFKDRHFESTKKHIVTFDDIPPEALTLKYEGTGRDSGFINEIKEHPNPEKFIPYKNEIDKIVYSVVNKEELCGYRLEYFLNAGEDALQIVLYYKDGFYPGYEKHTEHAVDIKSMIENYLPIVNMAFVAFDSTACKKRITENVDEIEKNLKVIRNILKQVSWEGLCDIWVEYNYLDKDYEIRSKSKLQDEVSPLPEIQKEFDFLDNTLRLMGLRTYIFTPWYVENCEDEVEFLNESKQNSKKDLLLKVLNDLILPQYEHIICGFELKNVDDESLNSVINYPGVIVKMIGGYGTRMWPKTQAVQKMYDDLLDDIWDTVWDYTGISLELYSNYVKECGSENINESEKSKQEIKFTKLLNNIEEYLNSNSYNSVVRFMVDYDEVMDDVIVNIFFDAEHAVKLGGGINSVIKKTGQKIMEDLSIFPFDFKYHIHFEKPQLNESKEETNYLPIIENIIEPFKEDECICNVDLWYDDEDDMYSVYLVFGTEELNDKFTSDGKFGYVRKKQKEVEETIKSYLPIKNIRVGSYGTPHCGWKSLNE